MVFESIVVDILNKFLGDYVENLDRSQLKIGIWGGDVALKNLTLKPSALDELNLPVKTVYGHLGKLVLKIPWKNIYTAPVEVSVQDLFLLAIPIQDIKYDPDKEEKLEQEAKQAIIAKVEAAKKKEKEKDNPKVDDTFVEKIAAQIIKNVQVFIDDIHIRYEDRVTKPERPFSIGISLHTLKIFTTNERCERYVEPENESALFYKLMVMDGLSIYWNMDSKFFADKQSDFEKMHELFLEGIASKSRSKTGYNYLLGPINSDAKLQINSKPELLNFITPKICLSLVLQQLLINLRRSQYQDLIALVEKFDRMSKATPYRKYRPHFQVYKTHYKEWWKFAITCVLEEDVKRRFKNWDWNCIIAHRALCKKYQSVYRAKLTEKVTEALSKELAELERKLDAFNIILIRQKVENEVEREGRLSAEQKANKKGWFGGWFSSTNKDGDEGGDTKGKNIVKQLENALDDEEKQKLYRAIDYHETTSPTMYPTSFVAIKMEFALRALKIIIVDDYNLANQQLIDKEIGNNSVLTVEVKEVLASISQRPAAQSFALSMSLQSFQTLGLLQNGLIPKIVKSDLPADELGKVETSYFLNIFFETNPEDERYDQRLYVTLRPLKIVYDAQTVIKILEVFTPEKDITTVTNQIQAAANTKFEEVKAKSALKLQYAVEKSTKLDLQVNLMAPYLILPFGGFYTKNELALVINLGRITVTSKSKDSSPLNVKRLLKAGSSEDEVLSQIMLKAYDCFSICLDEVQILALQAGQRWKPLAAQPQKLQSNSTFHILRPTSIHVDIYKCLIGDDPRLPKIKIDGHLPDVTIRITDKTLLEVVSLILSIPLPGGNTPSETPQIEQTPYEYVSTSTIYDSAASLRQKLESLNKFQFATLRKYRKNLSVEEETSDDGSSFVDFINLEAKFNLKAISVYVESERLKEPLIEASLTTLQVSFVQRLYSSEISAKLGKISLMQNFDDCVMPAISTPVESGTDQYLFFCKLQIADKTSPVFDSLYNSTAVTLHADFTTLYVVAHQEAIITTLQWVTDLQNRITELMAARIEAVPVQQVLKPKRRKSSASSNVSTFEKKTRKLKTKSSLAAIVEDQLSEISTFRDKKDSSSKKEVVELKVTAKLNEIQMCLQTASRPLATVNIDGLELSAVLKKSVTSVDAVLHSVLISDLNPETVYNKIAYIAEGKRAFKVGITMYNNESTASDVQENNFDLVFKAQMSSIQFVFINQFLMDVLQFANNFQTSKQMIAEASAAAVASAKMNVQQVYQSSTRISLDVFADAPVIIVPRNSKSTEIFLIDFGNLFVKNTLKKLSNYGANHTPIIDEISISLSDMQIIRTHYNRNSSPEHVLLKPVNYMILVKRNLSVSWFTEVPDFDIVGEFHPIHISITSNDYKLVMDTLQENLESESSHVLKSSTTIIEARLNEDDEETADGEITLTNVEYHENMEDTKSRTMLRFALSLESVTIDLYTINANSPLGLATFTLLLLKMNGNVATDFSMCVHASLSNCILDDTRPSKASNPVKRYMRKKTQNDKNDSIVSAREEDDENMIDVSLNKNSNDSRVDARVRSFILIFNVDHITKIQEFFMAELTKTKGESNTSKKQIVVNQIDTNKSQLNIGTGSLSHYNVIIEEPDIILVENLDDLNTNAIILNNEVDLKIRVSADGRLSIAGVLQNLQLYSCCYNPENRIKTASLILHPVTVDLNGSSSENGSLHLDTKISELNVTITAGTIALLGKILATLVPKVEEESVSGESVQHDYSDVWSQKPIKTGYWFLEMEEGVDALTTFCTEAVGLQSSKRLEKCNDIILISVPAIGLTVEAGVGKKTVPLLCFSSSFQGTVTKTVEEITVEGYVSLEVASYNGKLAFWEPIIEPVMQDSIISSKCTPWQLQFKAIMLHKARPEDDYLADEETAVSPNISTAVSAVDGTPRSPTSAMFEKSKKQPLLSLQFSSNERLEVTFTKTCMDVVKTLTQSFTDAVALKEYCNANGVQEIGFSCYVFINDFGEDIELLLDDGTFELVKEQCPSTPSTPSTSFLEKPLSVAVASGKRVRLFKNKRKLEADMKSNRENTTICLLDKLNSTPDKRSDFLKINISSRKKMLNIPVSRADKRYFTIKCNEGLHETWGLISEVDVVDGNTTVIIASVVRVYNHLSTEVFVYYLKNGKSKSEMSEIGTVIPGQHLNIPVQVVYGSKGQLYFAPKNYDISSEPIVWKNLQVTVSFSKQIRCMSKNSENEDPFFMRVLGEMEQVFNENTASYTVASAAYSIRLRPTLILKNFLPIDVVCCLQGVAAEYILPPGETMNVPTAEPDHSTIVLRLDNYLDKVWSCKKVVKSDAPIFSVWTFTSFDSEKTFSLNLGVWYSICDDTIIFALYCPYWMVNKTGLNLSYKGVEDGGMILHHPKTFEEPILFSFKEKSFFSKKKACVRVTDGEWSDKFSMDVAGSSGSISCPYKDRIYQLGVYIRLNYNTLTKQVIFSPFYSISNNCPFAVELRESRVKNSTWMQIDAQACIPFWSNAKEDKDRTVELRIANTNEITSSFSYVKIRTHMLKLFNSYGGLQVDVQVTEGGVYIAIIPFQPKMATALIINDTNTSVEFTEIDLAAAAGVSDKRNLADGYKYETWSLKSKNETLFNWSSAIIDEPMLIVNKTVATVDLRKDGIGELNLKKEEEGNKKFWISFLYGMQRVLLITADPFVVKEIEAVGDFEQIQREISICLEGIGFSLVNNFTKQELVYVTLSSSNIVWEVQKQNKRFSRLCKEYTKAMEKAYNHYCLMLKSSADDLLGVDQEVVLDKDNTVTVNFNSWNIVKPVVKKIRRRYNSGLWLQVRSSERYNQIHAKINRLQIDNQNYDCVFPVILSPVPPPKSVAGNDANGAEKPFAELSIVQRIDEFTSTKQFKYFKVLVQEFHVKVDIGFINGLVKFIEADCISDEEEMAQFQMDKKVTEEPLCVHVSTVTSQDFYDELHFSPLKIHISFSLCGENPSDGTPQQGLPIVNLLTQSVGVTLTDVNDVVFRLAYFERKHKFYSQAQLMSEVATHYTGQFVKQLYVLVLGLDVLGNPFGLVTGLKQGVEDFFYEPFQGAIQGPSEFAEGVLLGVRSLFGHTVGGAAGAVGRITGAMGKGIAALTLDDDYQKKRRQRLAQQQNSIAEGGRGVVMGVLEGVSGVISKPISGAREEGVGGFVKGFGKGVVGLFMRPTSGVVDFASGTVDAVRRATSLSKTVYRYRLPRHFRENNLVVPYSVRDAEGASLLMRIEKGKFLKTDTYVIHVPMVDSNQPENETLLLTNNRLIYIIQSYDVFCPVIKIEWQYTWTEINPDDGISESAYGINVRVSSNGSNRAATSPVGSFGSIFKRSSKGKMLIISDKELRLWLIRKMQELIKRAHRSC